MMPTKTASKPLGNGTSEVSVRLKRCRNPNELRNRTSFVTGFFYPGHFFGFVRPSSPKRVFFLVDTKEVLIVTPLGLVPKKQVIDIMSKTTKSPSKSKAKATSTKSKKKAPAKKRTKVAAKSKAKSKAKSAKKDNENLELLNETGRRKQDIKPPVERRKRRRQIDPTTCERDYSDQEIEFMQAMDDYKQQSGRMFPTCSEILEVLMKIGYRQVAEASELMFDPEEDKKKVVEEESLDTRFEDEDDDEE